MLLTEYGGLLVMSASSCVQTQLSAPQSEHNPDQHHPGQPTHHPALTGSWRSAAAAWRPQSTCASPWRAAAGTQWSPSPCAVERGVMCVCRECASDGTTPVWARGSTGLRTPRAALL